MVPKNFLRILIEFLYTLLNATATGRAVKLSIVYCNLFREDARYFFDIVIRSGFYSAIIKHGLFKLVLQSICF